MKKVILYFNILIMLVAMTGCKNGNKTIFTPTSSGRAYEMLVVVTGGLWERPAGRALFDVLDTDVPGLPQPERSFRISYTDPMHYDQVLKMFRNIIIVDVQDIYSQPKMKYAQDVHAVPQMVLTIQAPDEKTFETFVEENGQVIIDLFVKAEMNRQINFLRDKHNNTISGKVSEMFDCDIWLPTELAHYKEGNHFFWASTNAPTADMNFVMYSFPYRDKDTFTKEYYMNKRDSVMKVNLPGAQPGMYMATDTLTVETRNLNIRNEFTMEARGLWHIKGDMMGGPFVSHSRIDRVNGRVVVAEVFIYSPDKLKRNLMRQMEASLYTLKFPYENVKQTIPLDNVPNE